MGDLSLDAILNLDTSSKFLLLATICAFLIPIAIVLPPVMPSKGDALLQTHSLASAGTKKAPSLKDALKGASSTTNKTTLQTLTVYPVTSCPGTRVTKSRLRPHGLEHDGLFTFAQLSSPFPAPVAGDISSNGHAWSAITRAQFPGLDELAVELWLPDEMKLRKQSLRTREAFVLLRFPWTERGWWPRVLATVAAKLSKGLRGVPEREVLLAVDFPGPEDIRERGYEYEDLVVGKKGETVTALNVSKEIPEELRRFLGVSNKLGLFRIDHEKLRKESVDGQRVFGFQDGAPLRIHNLTSTTGTETTGLADRDSKQADLPVSQPNIIVSGAPARDEESWKQIRLRQGTSGLFNYVLLEVSRSAEGSDRGRVEVAATPLFAQGLAEEDREAWVGVGMEVEVEQRTKQLKA